MPPKISGLTFTPGARKPTKPAPKPTSRDREVSASLGIDGTSPFARPLAESREAVRRSAQLSPNPPSERQLSRGYDRAVIETFDHQPEKVKRQILKRAAKDQYSYEARLLLGHVTGKRGEALEKAFNAFRGVSAFEAEHSGSPLDAIGGALSDVGAALKKGLTPYSSDDVGLALGNPNAYLSTPGAQSQVGISNLANTARLQQGLQGVSNFLTRGIDAADQRGLIGGSRANVAGFDGGQIAVNALKDLVNLPAEAIPSLYLPASKAAEGDVKGAGEMLLQPYKDFVEHPGRSFTEHPLNSGLLFYGPGKAASRGVGRVGRGMGVEAFSQQRAPLTAPGTGIQIRREYSADPLVKGVQVLRERARRRDMESRNRKAQALEDQALREGDRPDLELKAAQIRDQAARRDPALASHHQMAKLVDEFEGTAQGVQATHRDEVVLPTRQMLREIKPAGHAISPLTQGFVHPSIEGLRAYRERITQAGERIGDEAPAERAANRALRVGLDKAIRRAEKGDYDPAQVRAVIEQQFQPLMQRLEKKLADYEILAAGRAERSKLVPHAALEGIRDAPSETIRRSMVEKGLPEPIFLTQAPNKRGAGNFYRHFSNPGTIGRHGRTGQATVRGTFDADPETLVEQVSRMQGLVDAHENYGRFLGQFGFTRSGSAKRFTTFETRRQAERAQQQLNAQPGSPGWQIVRVSPFKGRESATESLIDGMVPEAQIPETLGEMLDSAVRGEGEGKFALVPTPVANRMREHLGVLGPNSGGRLWRLVSGQWRKNVLATSPTWLAGQGVEGNVRRLLMTRPGDKHLAKVVAERMQAIDPEEALRADVASRPGGVYGMAQRTVRTAADQFQGASPALAQLARSAGAFMQLDGPKQAARAWNAYTHFVFSRLNEALERGPQQSMQGAYLRKRFDIRSGLRVSEKALEQAAEGMRSTPEQVAAARFIRRAFGQYSAWSPAVRRVAVLYTPFAAWAINSVRFFAQVLPADHPVLTALIADTNTATEEWRKEHGLDLFANDRRPGFLQGAIPLSDGRSLRWPNRYLPFSLAGDPGDNVANLVLPQLSGFLDALQGRDWTGHELRNSDGTPFNDLQKFAYGTLMFGQGMIPTATKATQLIEADGDATDRLKKVFNPFGVTASKGSRKSPGPSSHVPQIKPPPTVHVPTISAP